MRSDTSAGSVNRNVLICFAKNTVYISELSSTVTADWQYDMNVLRVSERNRKTQIGETKGNMQNKKNIDFCNTRVREVKKENRKTNNFM
jgi:hypothetical protein